MQERTRYRVTGTLFLLSLAVIFVPMLFDGAGEPALVLPDMPPPEALAEPLRPYEEVVPETDVVDRVVELQAEVDTAGFATDSGARFGEPVLATPTQSTDVFAVQAASFAELANARKFRERLRDDGFEAFVSTSTTSAGTLMYRVAVGPLLSRDDAEQMQASISSRFAVDARVMELSP